MARLYNGEVYIYIIREKALSLFNEAIISLSFVREGREEGGASSFLHLVSLRIRVSHPRRLPRLITLHAVAGLLSRGFFVILDNLVPYELIQTSLPLPSPPQLDVTRRVSVRRWRTLGSLMNTYNRRENPFPREKRSCSRSCSSINATN